MKLSAAEMRFLRWMSKARNDRTSNASNPGKVEDASTEDKMMTAISDDLAVARMDEKNNCASKD